MNLQTEGQSERKAAFRRLIAALDLTQAEVAAFLNEATGDKVAPQTVRRWISDQAATATKCPGWPIALLSAAGTGQDERLKTALSRASGRKDDD